HTYEEILSLQPKSQRAIRALGKVQGARGDAAGLARTLERELEEARDPDARVQLLLQLGALYEEKLGQRSAALDRYRTALEVQPTSRQVHAVLERFLGPGAEERAAVAALLVPVYERIDDAAKIAAAIEVLTSVETDPAARLAYDRRLTTLYAKKLRD